MINGESAEAYKNSNKEVYKATIVNSGEGVIKVTKVGDSTLFGEIASLVQEKTSDSPLKIKLRELAGVISKIGYIGAFLVFVS